MSKMPMTKDLIKLIIKSKIDSDEYSIHRTYSDDEYFEISYSTSKYNTYRFYVYCDLPTRVRISIPSGSIYDIHIIGLYRYCKKHHKNKIKEQKNLELSKLAIDIATNK